jgi:general secretion pathway protein D
MRPPARTDAKVASKFNDVQALTHVVLAIAGLLGLAACNTATTYLDQPKDQPQNAADVVRSADLEPRYPRAAGTVDTGGATAPKGFSFFGSSVFGSSSPAQTSTGPTGPARGVDVSGDGYTLNFENAPVTDVAKSVLGDTLGLGYVIDPRVQGAISLSSERPIAKKDMLFVLESALRANNLMMAREGPVYRIAPSSEASGGRVDRAGSAEGVEPGYGMTVVPLRYVSGTTALKLLEGFAARPGAIRTDPSGQLLMVLGAGSERQSALEVVRSFDVDWLEGQSVGMYPVQNSAPEPIVAQLEKIMDTGDSGLGHGLVKFEAVSRLNSILAVASKPDLLRAAARWISRLDEPSAAAASVKVYKVQYGDAKQIAQMLTQIFVASGASSAANEIAPSSGTKALTPSERLTGGRPQSASEANAAGAAGAGSTPGGSTPGGAAAQFGALPVATLNSELATLGQGGGGGGQLPNVRITADPVNNSVLIYAKADEYKIIERTLIQLDRPRLQVAIEVTIAEVTLNDQLNYGVQFWLHGGAVSNTLTGVMPNEVNNLVKDPVGPGLGSGLNVVVGNALSPRVVINALHQLTDVRILSNPSLVVVDNGEATLEVGDQIPVSTGSANVLSANNAVVNTIDYKNTGIILHVQPRANANGSVLLAIDQEISSVPPGSSNSTTLNPTISQRKVTSQLSVVSGQTVLLAGLIQDQQQNSRQGVPLLNQIPYVGGAFGASGKADTRTELIIFIRPQIIRDGVDASMVAEELRSKMRGGRSQALSVPGVLNINARPLQ